MDHVRTSRRQRLALVSAAAATILLTGFGGESTTSPSTPLSVVASFYPLEMVVERVGGEFVVVSNLTPAGVEPHDMELTPQGAASLQDADLVVYLDGFAPAVDDAVAQLASEQVFDVTPAARLDLDAGDHDQADDDAGVDPHFWLDPTRLADVADAVAVRLGELDPDATDDFTANASTLRDDLEALDVEFETGLTSCVTRELVTSHTAFGYLADRYGMTQVGLTGLSPEDEPAPAEMAEITDLVEDDEVSTIYYETLVDPALAETIAAETGASTAVLDPLEGLTDDSAGADYFEVMRVNLETLRAGQDCT